MAAIEDRRTEAGEQLERLYEEHGGRVRAICVALLRDRDEAEDAAQQVFLSALRSLHRGTAPRDAGAWLATITRHECWARSGRPAVVPLDVGLHDVRAEDPSASALSRAELAETWQTVAALPGRQREVLLLREVRGLGYDELAEDLQLSRPSVRSLLSRARHTLRTQLGRGVAVLTGGPWLNTFARLFGDGPNPALTSVTRTAAVGLGAVAITGSVVVVPDLVAPSHTHRAAARASHQRASLRSPSAIAPTNDRRRSEVVRTEEPHRLTNQGGPGHEGGSKIESSGGSGSGGSESSGGNGGGSQAAMSGESSQTSSSGSSGGPGLGESSTSGSGSGDSSSESGPTVTVTTVSGSDGGGASSTDVSGSSDSGSSGSSGGSDGGGSSSDGGD